jgi:hypothetical protein
MPDPIPFVSCSTRRLCAGLASDRHSTGKVCFDTVKDSFCLSEMPILHLPDCKSRATLRTTYPSHRSFLRKVTCIKDGFFFFARRFCAPRFCAGPLAPAEVAP